MELIRINDVKQVFTRLLREFDIRVELKALLPYAEPIKSLYSVTPYFRGII